MLLQVGLIAVVADLLYESQFASLIRIGAKLLADGGTLQHMLVDSDGVEKLVSVDKLFLERFFTV